MTEAIVYNDKGIKDLQTLLERLDKVFLNRKKLNLGVAETMLSAVQENFLDSGRDVAGNTKQWHPLSAVTLERRGKKRNSPILRVSNRLYHSLHSSYNNDAAAVGTNVIYAALQHYGAKKGEFGKWRNHPIPWGDIPARPYMMLTNQDIQDIIDFISEKINEAAHGK
ncbi:phage virion morphogenesis protein [bacterium]|nr:phage virion morphogenesis protein [bacterium]